MTTAHADAHVHRWTVPEHHAAVIGPGSPLHVVTEDILGAPTPVFATRPPHLRAVLERAGVDHAAATYLATPDISLTYRDLAASVARVARWLQDEHGVVKGDRVAIAAANGPEHVVAWWATAVLGAIVTGLNGWWTPTELAYGISLTEPVVILADEARRARLGDSHARVVDLAALTSMIGPARADDPALPDHPLGEDDPVVILFTSGTTGRPKGATLSHRNFVHLAMAGMLTSAVASPPGAPRAVAARPNATLLPSPLFHVSGAVPLIIAAAFGTRIVLPPPGRWDERTHLALTAEHAITAWSAVPTQLWRLLEHPDFDQYDTTSVVSVGGGGAVYAPELFRLIRTKMPQAQISTGYGMTETTGFGSRLAGVTLDTHPASVGRVGALCALQIRDAAGEPLPDGEIGEIHVKGASVFLGYWNDPDATRRVLDGDRWYASGDYGRFVDGVLFLESRMRDLIIRGGENIYPIEIENRLVEHVDIVEACVVGVDHHQLGHEVAAAVVRRPGSSVDAAAVRAFVGEALAPFKVPTHVLFVDELPYTATGKVLKRDVETLVREQLG